MKNEEIADWIKEITDFVLELTIKCKCYEQTLDNHNEILRITLERLEKTENQLAATKKELENISLLN